jgi:hypothetical protein
MQTIGLIGAGHIGSQLARLAVRHGYNVVISNSRGPESLAGLVAALGPKARAATPAEAAKAGDIVVITVPLKAYGAVPVAPLAGKVVIDTNNYDPERARLNPHPTSTASRARPAGSWCSPPKVMAWGRRSRPTMAGSH